MGLRLDGANLRLNPSDCHPFCAAPSEYPEPRVNQPNRYYAQILLDCLGGPSGELTAVNQYMYHFQVLSENHSRAAAVLFGICEVEMYHMYLLGKTICLLGGLPKYTSSLKAPWEGNLVYHGKGVHDCLSANLHLERLSIEKYKEVQTHLEDPFVQMMLERIIQDEEIHVESLSALHKPM